MSSNVPVSRTVVPTGITDPVEIARAELKAALAAIEEKVNVPKRVGAATRRGVAKARAFAKKNPAAALAIVVASGAAIGFGVWALVRRVTQ